MIVSGNTFESDPWDSHTARLWFELAKEFDEVHIFARSTRQRWEHLESGTVQLHLIPMGPPRMATFFLSSWLMAWPVWRMRPTHLMVQSPVYGGPAAVTYSRVFQVPVLVELHGDQYLRHGEVGERAHKWFFRPIARWTLRRATLVRSLAPEMTSEIRDVFGEAIVHKAVEIPTRVNLELFSPAKKSYAMAGPTLRIAYVGSLTARKNQRGLVRDLENSGIECELLLVGEGPEARSLRAEAEVLQCVRLDLCGQLNHEELAQLLRSVDIYVHYSKSEAAPRAILEAMALGLPVVVGPAGFLGGIVDDDRTGLRLSELDAGQLAAALHKLEDEQTRQRLGSAARQRVEDRHEWAAVFGLQHAALRRLNG